MMHERKRKGILVGEVGPTGNFDLYLIQPSLQSPPLIHFFSSICLVYVDAKNSKAKG